MGKKNKKRKYSVEITEKIMLATLASSMVMSQAISVGAVTYDESADVVVSRTSTTTSAVSIIESKGFLESASVEWKAVAGATGYNVYYKASNESDSEFKQIDSELIRQYSSYIRADVLGLTAGEYVIKVVPIINNEEDVAKKAITETISVKAQTREGFAFSAESPMGTGSGGYNDDGTVQSDATILYVTADNVNTITTDVVTNSKGSKTTCTGLVDILAKRQKGYDKTPLIIRMIGQVKSSDISGLNSNGYLQIKGCYNVTFEGVGEDSTAYEWGFLIRDSHNVELRNVGVMLFPDDAISLDTGNENIWVHNNDIFYGTAGSDKDQAKGDGSCDVKGKSTYVTVSYNHFWDSGKCSLCGMSDSENFYVTYHHNWYDHSDSRHPRIRVGTVHIYNNYFDGNSKYGVGITKGGSAFVEANYFRNCKYPMLISMQGTDVADGNTGTFSGEAGGMIKAYNNIIEGAKKITYAQDDSTEFDAYLATSRNETVPSSYSTVSGGNKYNNFDTSSIMYKYSADAPEDVESIVTTYAGRVDGGDFVWQFTDADDVDYSLNSELMEKIKNYSSDLVSIGGNSIVDNSNSDDKVEDSNENIDKEQTSDTTTDNNESSNNEITVGNLNSTGMYTNIVDLSDSAFENAVYASNSGSSSNDGSYNSPLTLDSALEKVSNGEAATILLRGGTYNFSEVITITNSGSKDSYNVLKGCKGEEVVLDFSNEAYSSDTSLNDRGIQLNGDYWYIGNVTIKGAADNGIMVSGSHNIIERCILDGNRDTGLQISRKSSAVTDFKDFPSYNYIINCTSRNNCDPATYENADGFAAKLTCGEGNVFDGCLSYNNSDDGWDLFAKEATGSIGVVTIQNCIAMRNGSTEDGTTNSNCDGNGFKLGGSGIPTAHVVTNCIAIENLHHGFTDNNNPAALKITNCTAYDNNQGGSKNNFSLYRCKDAIVSNCISYTSNGTSDKFMNLIGDHLIYNNSKKWYKVTEAQSIDTSSSASRGEAISNGTSKEDFVVSSIPVVGTDFDKVWRNDDGTINTKGVAIVTKDSDYGSFASDGEAIGARVSSTNKISQVVINVGTINSDNTVETPDDSKDDNVTVPDESVRTHNFTTDGLEDDFFNIVGKLSTSKGEVEYNGLNLTQCLKIESSTKITFDTSTTYNLTLVFNSDFNKDILIDGKKYTAKNGIITVTLESGSHVISKEDTANLFYMSLEAIK